MNRAADAPRPAFTARQGQFLAFIHAYTLVNGNRGKTPGGFDASLYRSAVLRQKMAEFRASRSDIERMLHLRARTFAPVTGERTSSRRGGHDAVLPPHAAERPSDDPEAGAARIDLSPARCPAEHRRPAPPLRLTHARAKRCSTGQNLCAEVLGRVGSLYDPPDDRRRSILLVFRCDRGPVAING